MNKYKVYVYENLINGKKYVGQTSRTLKQRACYTGVGYKGNNKFYRAICKYGFTNFVGKIVKDGLTKQEANELETRLIEKYDTIKNGYNILKGGYDTILIDTTTHGLTGTDIYNKWTGMKNRVKEYKIPICKDWLDLTKFNEWATNNGYKEGLHINRIDYTKGYEPNNCKWTTNRENTQSKHIKDKVKHNIKYEYNGEMKTMHAWAKILPIGYSKLYWCIKEGMTIEQALKLPKYKHNGVFTNKKQDTRKRRNIWNLENQKVA